MDKAMRKLMSNTLMLRNWMVLSNYVTNRAPRDYKKASLSHIQLQNRTDIQKFISLRGENDCKGILKSIQEAYNIADGRTAITVLDSLKRMKDKIGYNDLKDSKEFIYLCSVIQKDVKYLNIHYTLHTLSLLLDFNIPLNSRIIQTLLQIIRVSINNLSISQIIRLYDVLYPKAELPFIKSLVSALPEAFKIKAKNEIDNENKSLLIESLLFASRIHDIDTLYYIISILSKTEQDADSVIPIYIALIYLPKLNKSFFNLLYKVEQVIKKNPESLKFNSIYYTIDSISKAVIRGHMDIYKENSINVLCNAALNNNISFHEGIRLLSRLNIINFSSTSLLEYLAQKYIMQKDDSITYENSNIHAFLRGFTIANYKPPFWKEIQLMISNYITNIYCTHKHRISFAYNLMSLDCYCPELLNKVFSSCNSDTSPVIEQSEKLMYRSLVLYYCTKTFYPEYTGAILDQNIVNSVIEMQRTKFKEIQSTDIRNSLVKVMGSAKYVKYGLSTKLGHFIDYTIAVQPNGSPIAIDDNSNMEFIEDYPMQPGSQKLLIFTYPEWTYSVNLQSLCSTWLMRLKSVEVYTGNPTLVLNPYLWKNFSEYKKVTYLEEAIKSKLSINK